jgi:DNA mismatch repair protein MutL
VQKIRVLPAELANQIAAGEVVERPASAVKELVENSLDAGATRVAVEIEGGGVTLIAVADDGAGMNDVDLRTSVERHATSKLSTLADLGRVKSFGFRGEALPSIASVSRFSITTRPADSDAGHELVIEGGAPATIRPVGVPVGTRVEVRDLFYNVPARRKFLRSTGTESGRVTDVVEAAALSRFDVTFTLHRDKRPVREWLRANDRGERVAQVTAGGTDLARCQGERGPLRMEAFLSRPEHARTGSAALRILVNERPVRDRALALTVAQAYGSVLERGRYPGGVVYLNLPPELVDVNVHPQKAEVRFADPRAVTDALYSMLSRELASAFSLPVSRGSPWGKRQEPATKPAPVSTQSADPWGLGPEPQPAIRDDAEPPETTPSETERRWPARSPDPPLVAVQDSARAPIRPSPEQRWSSLRFIAQVKQTFLVCEADDGLYVLDQHAAAERVTFDRLRKAYRSSAVGSQSLLFPVMIDVTPAEAELVEARAEEIAAIGLDLRVRSSETVSIHGVPRLLQKASPERIVRDLLSEVTKTGGRGFSDAVDLALATMACHGSIRAGDVLNATEATALLRALDEADFAGHCPHGRPVVKFTSWAELDRSVGRR